MTAVLVAYGVPPNHIELYDSVTHRDLHREWKFDPKTFSGRTRQNFEALLRQALTAYLMNSVPDIAHADYRFTPTIAALRTALHSRRYTHLVYYGHALDDGVTLKPLHKIAVADLAAALNGSSVKEIDILGCQSATFAAHLASRLPQLTVGNLRGRRFDDVEVDLRTMQLKKFTIVPQQIFYFRPQGAR